MKGPTRFPLWLICDVGAAIRLALATWLLSSCVLRYWPKNSRKPPTPKGIASISLALSCAEALVRWAIIRQALRACGLDPRTARLFQPPLAGSSFTWLARCRTFVRLVEHANLYARRWAKRIQAAMATKPAAPACEPATQSAHALAAPAIRVPFQPAWTRGIPAPP